MSELYVAAYDIHFPAVDWPTFNALLAFLEAWEVDGFVFGGDQFDNQSISPHTKGKPGLRERGALVADTKTFNTRILQPIEKLLSSDCERVWIEGNHDDWLQQFVDEQPEMDGLQRPKWLGLDGRGWDVVPCGQAYKKGKLTFIHGETLTGVGNQASQYHAKKAVESYCSSVVYGHMHSPQSYTKVLPHDETNKWMAYCSPIIGKVNPAYLRNRPTAWLNGFTIVEFGSKGNFNVFPIVVSNGQFTFGGETYGS